jgi:hypothetical protein
MDRSREPSSAELLLLTLCACVALATAIQLFDPRLGFWDFGAGDTPTYVSIATAIRTGDLAGLRGVKHFWGVAYLAAGVALLTRLPDVAALLLVSLAGSLASVLLARRLWGGWIAAIFALVSWDWLAESVLGGSETAFMAFALSAFLAARRERWTLAALAASCSMTVRPVGCAVLLALLTTLLARVDFRRAAVVAVVGAVVAALYIAPLWVTRGDVLAHFRGYQPDWAGGSPLGLPFAALTTGFLAAKTSIEVVRPAIWVAFILLTFVLFLARKQARAYATLHPVEATFAAAYVVFLFSYNARRWAWLDFPRFAIPLIPFALVALDPWLPRSRWLLWPAAPASGILAAGWLIGFHRAWHLVQGAVAH